MIHDGRCRRWSGRRHRVGKDALISLTPRCRDAHDDFDPRIAYLGIGRLEPTRSPRNILGKYLVEVVVGYGCVAQHRSR